MSLFNDLITSLSTIGKYCSQSSNSSANLKHFYKTEFYNEGWMLKLAIACLREINDPLSDNLSIIQSASKKGWMSEGRLSAAFTHEQSTHADAVLGDIEIDDNSSWGVAISPNMPSQFVVVEAKLGSRLADKTTNAQGFNQAARNMACMALAMHKAKKFLPDNFTAHFFVVIPECDDEAIIDADMKIDAAREVITQEAQNNITHKLRTNFIQQDELEEQLSKINAQPITWESIILGIRNSSHADMANKLDEFYQLALIANNLRPKYTPAKSVP